jgi:hypothetical protein
MSVFRTLDRNHTFTIPGSTPITITNNGTLVPDVQDTAIITAATNNGIVLIQGGTVDTPLTATDVQYITHTDMVSYVSTRPNPIPGLVNIKDSEYGALGDGNTNDTAAIQAALNVGGITYFPPGRYAISSLNIPPGAVLRGSSSSGYGIVLSENQHSTLVRIANTNQHMLVGAQGAAHVRIENMHLDGNKNNNTSGDGIHINQIVTPEEGQWRINNCFIEANPGYGVFIGSGRRACRVTDTDIQYSGSSGLRIDGSDSVITRCILGTHAVDGIQVGASVTRITDCDIYGNGTSGNTGTGNGINVLSTISQVMIKGCGIDRNLRHGVYLSPNSLAVSIVGCDFHANSQDVNGGAHHINVNTTSGIITLAANVFGRDGGLVKTVGYCIYLDTNASVYESGSVTDPGSGTSNLGFTNDTTRMFATISAKTGIPAFMRSGLYYAASVPSTTGVVSNDTLRVAPIQIPKIVTLDRIGCEVTVVGQTGSTIALCIFGDDGTGYPGPLVLNAGTVAVDITGVKELTISQLLKPGTYWIGGVITGSSTTPPTLRLLNGSETFVGVPTNTAALSSTAYGYSATATGGVIPTNYSTTISSTGTIPKVFIRAA